MNDISAALASPADKGLIEAAIRFNLKQYGADLFARSLVQSPTEEMIRLLDAVFTSESPTDDEVARAVAFLSELPASGA